MRRTIQSLKAVPTSRNACRPLALTFLLLDRGSWARGFWLTLPAARCTLCAIDANLVRHLPHSVGGTTMSTYSGTIDNFGQLVQENLHETGRFRPFRSILLIVRFGVFKKKSDQTISLSREVLNRAVAEGLDAKKMQRMYGKVAGIRNNLSLFEAQLGRFPCPQRVLRGAEDLLAAWDELAEDWAFASDPEVRELAEAVAAKL